jgi:amidase
VTDIMDLDALTLARAVRSRSIGPVEVVHAAIRHIEGFNPLLNAVCTTAFDQALEAARRLEAQLARGEDPGPLAGVLLGVKDVIETGGIRTTYASPLFRDHVPKQDAIAVARLKKAGAIVIGKTNTPEFAAGASTFNALFGATRNPWDPSRSPGGSSGGNAAALAAHMIQLALGTDLGGSLRVPSAFCGGVGIRPTPGRVPAMPVPIADDRWQVTGPQARSARDVAVALDALSGLSHGCPASVPSGPVTPELESFDLQGRRFAYCTDIARIGVEPEIGEICEAASKTLARNGAVVEVIDLDLSAGREAFLVLRGRWMLAQRYDRLDDISVFGENVANNIRLGLKYTARDLARADWVRTDLLKKLSRVHATFDVLLTPTAPVAPFPVEQNYPTEIAGKPMATYIDWIAPTFLFSMLGSPAATVPAGLTRRGLPVGLQIVGRRFEEGAVLAVADAIQSHCPVGSPPLGQVKR